VGGFHWLTERQFLDAVAIAMITLGPVVITSGFIGYSVAGPLRAFAATLAVFLPPHLLVVFGAPYYRRFAKNRQVKAFVQGVTAAAVGSYCRRSNHFEQTRGNGFDDCSDCCGFHSSIAVIQENSRTSQHSRSRDRGHDCEARVVVTCLGGT